MKDEKVLHPSHAHVSFHHSKKEKRISVLIAPEI